MGGWVGAVGGGCGCGCVCVCVWVGAGVADRRVPQRLPHLLSNKWSNELSNRWSNKLSNRWSNKLSNRWSNKWSNKWSQKLSNKWSNEYRGSRTDQAIEQVVKLVVKHGGHLGPAHRLRATLRCRRFCTACVFSSPSLPRAGQGRYLFLVVSESFHCPTQALHSLGVFAPLAAPRPGARALAGGAGADRAFLARENSARLKPASRASRLTSPSVTLSCGRRTYGWAQ